MVYSQLNSKCKTKCNYQNVSPFSKSKYRPLFTMRKAQLLPSRALAHYYELTGLHEEEWRNTMAIPVWERKQFRSVASTSGVFHRFIWPVSLFQMVHLISQWSAPLCSAHSTKQGLTLQWLKFCWEQIGSSNNIKVILHVYSLYQLYWQVWIV